MNYNIEKVTTLIGARRFGTADANIGFLLTDSRSLCFPEETLFFDDSQTNLDAAAELGFKTWLVAEGTEFMEAFGE